MADIRIDAPGVGAWIMERASGHFHEGFDHTFSTHDGDQVLGGFALVDYLGGAMTVHMASEHLGWCPRQLLWMVFDYAFNHLKLHKLLAVVRHDNYHILAMNLRAGWNIEFVLRDVFPDGKHMVVLSMTRDSCRWFEKGAA